jgi:hypothetical protein
MTAIAYRHRSKLDADQSDVRLVEQARTFYQKWWTLVVTMHRK